MYNNNYNGNYQNQPKRGGGCGCLALTAGAMTTVGWLISKIPVYDCYDMVCKSESGAAGFGGAFLVGLIALGVATSGRDPKN